MHGIAKNLLLEESEDVGCLLADSIENSVRTVLSTVSRPSLSALPQVAPPAPSNDDNRFEQVREEKLLCDVSTVTFPSVRVTTAKVTKTARTNLQCHQDAAICRVPIQLAPQTLSICVLIARPSFDFHPLIKLAMICTAQA